MKDILQQVIKKLENATTDPQALDSGIEQLQAAKEQYGDRGTMIENTITALIQAKHSLRQLESAKDASPYDSIAQAHNALEQAMKSCTEIDNDPI